MRNGELKELFDTIEEGFAYLNIDFYLIGALARQVWYDKEDIVYRRTKDVDYGVLISTQQEYEEIKRYLITRAKFTESQDNAFLMISPDGIQVDLLPFGDIENTGSVLRDSHGMTSIKVDGMMEVFRLGTREVTFETGHTFKVATLSGITILKFIAYDDRPEQRQKDITDIANIIKHFFQLHEELIYEEHNDLFDESINTRFESIGPIVLGREMQRICNENEGLKTRIASIFAKHIEQKEQSSLLKLLVAAQREAELSIEDASEILKNIRRGFLAQ
ncbi:hypothetical protein ACFSQ3_08720 [Sphingobacterium corticis]|uniref:Nucleotidyltransferase n=1 Tax=Sphingobacterium corticis TaxID=1812823 RepID=A0ABW5NIU6_9SPHI